MADLVQFLLAECLPVAAVLYIIGMILKKTPKVPDWMIPYILLVLSPVFTMAVMIPLAGWTFDYPHIISAVMQGILSAGLAVFGNQLGKQLSEGLNKNTTGTTPEIQGKRGE